MATGMYFGTAYGTYVRRGKAASSRESVRFGAGLRNCIAYNLSALGLGP